MALLDGLFQNATGLDDAWSKEWNEVFGSSESPVKSSSESTQGTSLSSAGFCPSLLLERSTPWSEAESGKEPAKKLPKQSKSKQVKLIPKRQLFFKIYAGFSQIFHRQPL